MAFTLRTTEVERETEPFELHFDPKNPNRAPRYGADTDVITFHLATFRGADSLRFSDMMIVSDGEEQSMRAGTVQREKCLRAVVSIEGLQDEAGKPIVKLTREIYGWLPTWICNRLTNEINERNAEDDDEAGN